MIIKIPKRLKKGLDLFIHYFQQADISNNAIVLAYYLLLSLPPLLLVLGNLLAYLQVRNADAISYILQVTPAGMSGYLKPIISSFLNQGSNESLSLGILIAVWSASGMIATLRSCFNKIYQPKKQENPLLSRALSFLLLVLALLAFASLLTLIIFGQYLLDLLKIDWQHASFWLLEIVQAKNLLAFAGFFVLLCSLYYFVPETRPKAKYVWLGALFTDCCWFMMAALFQNYVALFAHGISSYQTIGTFIILMFWLNFSSLFLLLGAVINACYQAYFEPGRPRNSQVQRS
ncbi:YihY/virulence factor BrkB family protein [Oenococcus sp.]|uniref:YihY/virulence factor BrkB family protein n=1 Tax=Oenococcus sp. TaxID=1979414 RepID=UPI0039E862D5